MSSFIDFTPVFTDDPAWMRMPMKERIAWHLRKDSTMLCWIERGDSLPEIVKSLAELGWKDPCIFIDRHEPELVLGVNCQSSHMRATRP